MSDPRNYLSHVTHPIPGWMENYAGEVTFAMLDAQDSLEIEGSFFEIGVYAGKYLSILFDRACRTKAPIAALDPFEHFSEDQVDANLRSAERGHSVRYIKGVSTDITPLELIRSLTMPSRFISLDGSHDAEDVSWDLDLSSKIIHPKGIIAVDDFLNTECLGVVEAVSRFFLVQAQIVPFMFSSNKLFLCRRRSAKFYQDALEAFARARQDLPQNRVFIERLDANPLHAGTRFFGHWTLVMQ